MKKVKSFIAIVIFFTLSCCKKDQEPIPVAEQFLAAIQKRDYDKAAEFSTKETVKLLRQFEKIEALSGESIDKKMSKITIVSEDIQRNKAIVYFKEEGNELEQKITMVKVTENGSESWKVAMKKEEINVMGVNE